MAKARENGPPPEAARWCPGGPPPGGLLYLGWGNRSYGKNPILPSRHSGWTYMVIRAGTPTLLTDGQARRTVPGTLLLIGPEAAHGWEDDAGASVSILTWVWQRGPAVSGEEPMERNTIRIQKAGPLVIEATAAVHRDSWQEVHRADAFSGDLLKACQMRLDAIFARAAATQARAPGREEQRMRLAFQWMERHLDARSPAAGMAEYLGTSSAGLQRLFLEHAGDSPGRVFFAVKMRAARAMLRGDGASVKSVGLSLGYRNPGDFTRAYRRHFGRPPSADTSE